MQWQRMTKTLMYLILAAFVGLGLWGCDGEPDTLGERMEEAAEDVGDSLEDAADDVTDGTEDLGEEIKDAGEEIKEDLDDIDPPGQG